MVAREVVIPGRTGFLVPPRRIEPLAEALIQLAQQDDLAPSPRLAGPRAVHEPFRHERMNRNCERSTSGSFPKDICEMGVALPLARGVIYTGGLRSKEPYDAG